MDPNISSLLRALHILAGIIWVGFGLFQTFYLLPAINTTDAAGLRVMSKMGKLPGFAIIMPAAALIATLAGLALYGIGSWHEFLNTLGGVFLTIGVIAGVLMFGHGFGLGAVTNKFMKAVSAWQGAGEAESGAEYQAVRDLGARLQSNARISAILGIITVLGMVLGPRFVSISLGG